MGRFTQIKDPSFIDYSQRIPEALLYKAAEDINKKTAETDVMLDGINKLLNIKVAPSEQAQRDYQQTANEFIKQKNDIITSMYDNPSNVSEHNFKIKKLTASIMDSATTGKLKALKEQGDSYWSLLDANKATYKDEPELFQLAKSKLDNALIKQQYNPDLGNYGTLSQPAMVQNYKPKEVTDWFNDKIKNIAIEENMSEIEIRRIARLGGTDFVGITDQEKKAYSKVKAALSSIPQEFVNSYTQYNEATGYNDPNTGKPIDESQYIINGNINKSTRLGQLLDSYISGATQEKVTITPVNNGTLDKKSSGSGTGKAAEPFHSWWLHNPKLKAAGTALMNADPSDQNLYQAVAATYNAELDTYFNEILDPTNFTNDQQFITKGYVTPFVRGRAKGNFEENDVIFYPKTNKLEIRQYYNKNKDVNIPAKRNLEVFTNPTKAASFDPFITHIEKATYDLNKKEDKERAFKYFRSLHRQQDAIPKPVYRLKVDEAKTKQKDDSSVITDYVQSLDKVE